MADRVTRLVGQADHEVAACLPAADPLVTDRALLGPAPIRLLVETPADIDPALSACGQVKSADRLPASLVVCDRESAVVPLDTSAALLVRAPHLVALLCTLFELCWSAAAELGAPSTGLNDQERAVLTVLSRGATDELAAHRLGLSARSVRRIMAGLMARLGARSRFQAGQLAAHRGWI